MQSRKQLFEIVCYCCNEIYNYRLYDKDKILIESTTRPKGDYKAYQSHGICKICRPKEYARHGLDYKVLEQHGSKKI